MRYLTRPFAIGALRRGKGIEQFLGGTDVGGVPAIQWVAISPTNGRYRVSLHTAQDPDDDRAGDISEFLPLDGEGVQDEQYAGEGRELGHSTDEDEAIQLAERLTAATSDRWVNYAVAGDEYMDYVRARRSGTR